MEIGVEDILRNGMRTWNQNKILAIPYTLKLIVQAALFGLSACAVFFLLASRIAVLDPQALAQNPSALSGLYDPALIIAVLFIGAGFIVSSALVSAFFDAGAIGMARKAVESKETSLTYMTEYGLRRFSSLFLARLLITLATIIPMLLVGVVIVAIVLSLGPLALAASEIVKNTAGFGMQACILIATALAIAFAAAPYFIVIGGSGAVEGLEKSYRLLKENKKQYMLLWMFGNSVGEYASSLAIIIAGGIFALGLLTVPIELHMPSAYSLYDPSLVGYLTGLLVSLLTIAAISAGAAILALSLIYSVIVLPLTTVWWTELYLDKTKTHKRGQDD